MPDVPSADELAALPASELAARLAEAYRLIGELTAQAEELSRQNRRLAARVEQLERQAGKDSSTSSRPPSWDSPDRKKSRDRTLRERGKRRPGKQPGDPGTTMRLVDDPDETLLFPPAACRSCGAGLGGEPVAAQRRHQVTDIEPAPAPKVTEYVAQAKECRCCGTVTVGELPARVRARASYGPETCAQAANLTAGHHIPVYRATLLLCQLTRPGRGDRDDRPRSGPRRARPLAGRRGHGWQTAVLLTADLSVQADIRRVAHQVRDRYDHVDILVNNARAAFSRREQSADGLELTWATNYCRDR